MLSCGAILPEAARESVTPSMPTAFYSHPDCRAHDMGAGHPERPQRLDAISDWLIGSGIEAGVDRRVAPLVSLDDARLAHSAGYVASLDALLEDCETNRRTRRIDADTVASPTTRQAVLRAAGAAVAATDAVIDGSAANAFCAVRPPGHHATRNAAMGFCFFNNVVIAARHALAARGLERVAIVDFDVHHGNGTEDIIAGDQRMLMASIFQHPLYPGSGTEPKGTNMINVPVPPYTRGPEIRHVVETLWMPRLEAFRPQMIFFSAGFDAHRDDELGQLGLVEDDYAWITRRIKGVAERHAHGRIVSCLEGGYNLNALAKSVGVHLRVLAEL
jgi:acetoin utilization deacetylase AcuC-like enzyme